jgi:hypothetical protein
VLYIQAEEAVLCLSTQTPAPARASSITITMKEARGDFGALSVVISNSRLRLNETSLEDAL